MNTTDFRWDGVKRLSSGNRFITEMSSILFIALALSGCATIPEAALSYKPAPPPEPGSAIVYFYRVGAYPASRTPSVYINQKKIFDPPENAFTWIYVQEGKHKLLIDWAWDTGPPDLKADFTVKSAESYFVKISGSFEMVMLSCKFGSTAQLIPKAEAEKELQKCCRYLAPQNHQINLEAENY